MNESITQNTQTTPESNNNRKLARVAGVGAAIALLGGAAAVATDGASAEHQAPEHNTVQINNAPEPQKIERGTVLKLKMPKPAEQKVSVEQTAPVAQPEKQEQTESPATTTEHKKTSAFPDSDNDSYTYVDDYGSTVTIN